MYAETPAGQSTSRSRPNESSGKKPTHYAECVVCGDPADGYCAEREGPVCRYHGRQTPVTDGSGESRRHGASVRRHTFTETVEIGALFGGAFGDDHIRGEVTIEVSGASDEQRVSYELLTELEGAVVETVREFDVDDAGGSA